jgi:MYXO-CTERM domain-containing protein
MLVPPAELPGNQKGLWRFPSEIPLALLAALALGLLAVSSRRRPRQTIFAAAALIAALSTGCHHGSTVNPATPLGMTTLNISGIALDANGNSLGTSRTILGVDGQGFIIDVIASTGNGGGGGGILGGVSRRQNGF